MWAMEQKFKKKQKKNQTVEVCYSERTRETELEGGGEEWRWMEETVNHC